MHLSLSLSLLSSDLHLDRAPRGAGEAGRGTDAPQGTAGELPQPGKKDDDEEIHSQIATLVLIAIKGNCLVGHAAT